jgi:hypothetical protein
MRLLKARTNMAIRSAHGRRFRRLHVNDILSASKTSHRERQVESAKLSWHFGLDLQSSQLSRRNASGLDRGPTFRSLCTPCTTLPMQTWLHVGPKKFLKNAVLNRLARDGWCLYGLSGNGQGN